MSKNIVAILELIVPTERLSMSDPTDFEHVFVWDFHLLLQYSTIFHTITYELSDLIVNHWIKRKRQSIKNR